MKFRKGFTLIELLIVIAIIALLVVFVVFNLQGQNARAADIKRKTDLHQLLNAVEEYFNDHGMFPPLGIMSPCGGSGLMPYLAKIPCDPQTKAPYGYFLSQVTNGCRVCSKLSDKTDPAIAAESCSGVLGCGLGNGYNYCVASGTTASAVGTGDEVAGGGSTPTPTSGPPGPTTTPNPSFHFACAPADLNGTSYCNYYSDPVGSGCPITFANNQCSSACGVVANRCQQ